MATCLFTCPAPERRRTPCSMATQGYRRALGQHFLRDATIAHRIAEAAVEGAHEHGCKALLEIGPGRGAITEPLMKLLGEDRGAIETMMLSERDPKLASDWKARAPNAIPGLPVLVDTGDFLEIPEEGWLARTPLAVASNLPYSSGTAILTRLARHPDKIPVMVLMFQKEVAERLRAEPSTKAWGSLSVWLQNRWDVIRLCGVPPRAFMPPPQVDSEVVILRARSQPRIAVGADAASEAKWEALLKVCFAHRRKMMRSGLPPGIYRNALEASGLDGTKRAESLQWDEWEKLHQALVRL
jgi:16S rRNA (adenine1518-N6/adenine1519-N6)-dimethyltransferase